MANIKFYNTCSLLIKSRDLFEEGSEKFMISSISLKELERIKEDRFKDPEVKSAAHLFLKSLNLPENKEKCEIVVYTTDMIEWITSKDLEVNDDAKILATAYVTSIKLKNKHDRDELIFCTDDAELYTIAQLYFDENHLTSIGDDYDDYKGYVEIEMDENQMADYYSNQDKNFYNLYTNEYIIVKDTYGNIVDTACWTGEGYRHLTYQAFNSDYFGQVRPLKDDIQQAFFADSLSHNKITMIKGKPGAGKTYLSLAFLLSQLEKGKIGTIIIFCNTVAAKNAAKLGYYPGSKDEKLLDSQIGNMLAAKLGGQLALEKMIDEGEIVLIPLADIRGFDTGGRQAGVYITEAQNLDINLMKTALQRIGEDSICIIDGDDKAQVDDTSFSGANNGMRRASKIFRGTDIYGEVELQKIHRSEIAAIADRM